MKTIYQSILRILFEKLPVLSLFDGYKRMLGNWIAFLSGLSLLLGDHMTNLPVLSQPHAITAMILGVLIKIVGDEHAAAKADQK